jgi:hypothetical protein
MGRDEDHPWLIGADQPGELPSHLKAGLLAQVDVDQYDVWMQLPAGAVCRRPGRCRAYDRDPGVLQQVAGGAQEVPIVVDDQAAHGHGPSVYHGAAHAIAASRNTRQPGSLH